jgi:hypothetical protein
MAYQELIEMLASGSGVTLKLIARYHAAELGLNPDVTSFVRPTDEEPGWLDSLRELANRMVSDLHAE